MRTTLPTSQLQSRYLAWLVPDHIAAVKAGGADSVRVILPDRTDEAAPITVEAHYTFPSRKTFEAYSQIHAPALRATSLKHFPPETGIKSERQVSEIAAELE